ncbi:peptidase S8/S53 subtilisin kexin sedolisin [Catenovulum agarivorans DS-2]|uniref:Peptidase S8/S53 subtilisin kexin sedolisin n=1 Tax=Catenovulum agarivorans DS-2 TaxID=1328313 RepID=W7QVP1_9ALTE|nr:S8 family serine peptidase [Catenovulum agarivorans]EWH11783.1 peptidase S8/S53 subtilisin kexin sedolisin [Catenovulum agarivorans DS-2]
MVKFIRLNAGLLLVLSFTTQWAAADVLEQVTDVVEQSTETAEQRLEQVLQQADKSADKLVELPEQLPAQLPEKLQPLLDPIELAAESENILLAGISNNLQQTFTIVDAQGRKVFDEAVYPPQQLAVANEWLIQLDTEQVQKKWQQQLQQANKLTAIEQFSIENLAALDMQIIRLRTTPAASKQLNQDASLAEQQAFLAQLLNMPVDVIQQLTLERNFIYQLQAEGRSPAANTQQVPNKAVCQQPLKLGMLDSAIELNHPQLPANKITQQDFTEGGLTPAMAHGTGVAGIWMSKDHAFAQLPNAQVVNASAFYQRPDGSQGATMLSLIRGLNWLTEQNVKVINMSLTGPDNALLQRAIKKVAAKPVVIVAAVGNAGPASAPLYPAAYPEVIGVTAVQKNQKIYRWAVRGQQVDFAALGVDMPVLADKQQVIRQSGTSFAAPIVAAHIACLINDKPTLGLEAKLRLRNQAADLGEPGKDTVFGYGYIGRG